LDKRRGADTGGERGRTPRRRTRAVGAREASSDHGAQDGWIARPQLHKQQRPLILRKTFPRRPPLVIVKSKPALAPSRRAVLRCGAAHATPSAARRSGSTAWRWASVVHPSSSRTSHTRTPSDDAVAPVIAAPGGSPAARAGCERGCAASRGLMGVGTGILSQHRWVVEDGSRGGKAPLALVRCSLPRLPGRVLHSSTLESVAYGRSA